MAACEAEHMILIAQQPPYEFNGLILCLTLLPPRSWQRWGNRSQHHTCLAFSLTPIFEWTQETGLQMQPRLAMLWHQYNESPVATDTAGPSDNTASLVASSPDSLFSSPSSPPPPLFSLEYGKSGTTFKKWHHTAKDGVKKRKSARERQRASLFCWSQTASTLHSYASDESASQPARPPSSPSCLPAAVWSYEVVMSLVVMSLITSE